MERFSFCTSDVENLEEAYFWTDIALASDQTLKDCGLSKGSRARAFVLKKMLEGGVLHGPPEDRPINPLLTSEQIQVAQSRATKWFSEHHAPAQSH